MSLGASQVHLRSKSVTMLSRLRLIHQATPNHQGEIGRVRRFHLRKPGVMRAETEPATIGNNPWIFWLGVGELAGGEVSFEGNATRRAEPVLRDDELEVGRAGGSR